MEFTQKSVQCLSPAGLHRMAYTEWGDPENPRVVVCVHGLTRNGRDFDHLAQALAADYRVICPDVVGRGRSDHLRDPVHYGVPQYVADLVTLVARLDVEQVDWVGTSMGGLIGMTLAVQAGSPIRRLILNDVGPLITVASLQRIAAYVGTDPRWPSEAAALADVRSINAAFGTLSDDQWWQLTEHSIVRTADGLWRYRYDPRIAEPFRNAFVDRDIDLWPLYEGIRCPTLVIRGALSDLLTAETWQAMGQRGPRARLAEVPGVGHAPMFLDAPQVELVRNFLATS